MSEKSYKPIAVRRMFFKNLYQQRNVQAFHEFMKLFDRVQFYHPNEKKAPWHIQCLVTSTHGEKVIVNFWPHVEKAMADGGKVHVGSNAAILAMREAIERENVELFDDGDTYELHEDVNGPEPVQEDKPDDNEDEIPF